MGLNFRLNSNSRFDIHKYVHANPVAELFTLYRTINYFFITIVHTSLGFLPIYC
jgi:hypothetical protein